MFYLCIVLPVSSSQFCSLAGSRKGTMKAAASNVMGTPCVAALVTHPHFIPIKDMNGANSSQARCVI